MLDMLDRLSRIAYWSVGTLAHLSIIGSSFILTVCAVVIAVAVVKLAWGRKTTCAS